MYTNLSSFCWTIIILWFSYSIFRTHSMDLRTYHCSTTNGNYTHGDAFSANLDTFLANVTGPKSVYIGFYHLTVGENSGVDQVNGIALCRGDLNSSSCDTCLSEAVNGTRELCPYQREAFVWYDSKCLVWYSNRSIFGSLETWPQYEIYNVNNVSDPNRFYLLVTHSFSL
ncbi:hypothetical protein vseg_011305 [Gypsophila vaccaria]